MSSSNWSPLAGGGGGVATLNSLSGALTLVGAGGNTVTTNGINTITITGSGGTVTSVSVATANGFAGTSSGGATPALTLSTTVTGILYGNGTSVAAAGAGNFPTLNQNTTGTAANITATSNSTLTTLSALSLPGSQVTGNISGNAANITATSNATLTTLSALSLPYSQVTGGPSTNAITALTGDITATGPGSVTATLATVNANVGTFAIMTVNGKGLITAAANMTGDGTTSSGAFTLATVNSNVGSFGSSTAIPTFTVNGKGLITAAGTAVVVAPAGTLSGTTLNSTVVTSSLTSVGTIATGTWAGTTIAINHGGTGQTTASAAFNALSPMTTGGDIIYGGASGAGTRLANGTAGQVLTSAGTTLAPTWSNPGYATLVYAEYTTSTQSIGTSATVLVMSTQVVDTNSAYSNSTGLFTVPTGQAGKYLIQAGYVGNSTSSTGVAGVLMYCQKNGSANKFMNAFTYEVASVTLSPLGSGAAMVNCAAGDTLSVTLQRGSSITSFSLDGVASDCWVSFTKIGT